MCYDWNLFLYISFFYGYVFDIWSFFFALFLDTCMCIIRFWQHTRMHKKCFMFVFHLMFFNKKNKTDNTILKLIYGSWELTVQTCFLSGELKQNDEMIEMVFLCSIRNLVRGILDWCKLSTVLFHPLSHVFAVTAPCSRSVSFQPTWVISNILIPRTLTQLVAMSEEHVLGV